MEQNIQTQPKSQITGKDFFIHLGLVIALYVTASSFLTYLFQIINKAFPDSQAFYGDIYSTTIRMALSTLIVAFPILLLLLNIVHKDLMANQNKRDFALRRWFIYLTVFITSVTISVDLIVLINTFLNGEITTRFILKVLGVAFTAGAILAYCIYDLKGKFFEHPKIRTLGLIIVSIIMLASVVAGFVVLGSPSYVRDLKFDSQRIYDLQNIQSQILRHYQTTGKLPANLDELNDEIMAYDVPTDPETDESYQYKSPAKLGKGDLTFELCATFSEDYVDMKGRSGYQYYDYSDPVFGKDSWKYAKGTHCFNRTIDPLKYPIYKQIID